MNTLTGRYQVYADQWDAGIKETDLIPLDSISQVPMTFILGESDTVCQQSSALEHVPMINLPSKIITFEGEHLYFNGRANNRWFMQTLIGEL